jgi:acetolactate decarboxylase
MNRAIPPLGKQSKFVKMKMRRLLLALTVTCLIQGVSIAQASFNEVKVVGAMRNVMWKGQLFGNIHLDTISEKNHLYGLGPVEYLTGEILILDGKSYKSTIAPDGSLEMEETFDLKAPFFGYANIPKWKEARVPEKVETIAELEQYLDRITKSASRPFMFKLSGTVEQATIHVMNLPPGTIVRSPDDAHREQVNFKLDNEPFEILGFFSTAHQAIFTHHDTFLHMHLITEDRQKMGHLDDALFRKGTLRLYLPAE